MRHTSQSNWSWCCNCSCSKQAYHRTHLATSTHTHTRSRRFTLLAAIVTECCCMCIFTCVYTSMCVYVYVFALLESPNAARPNFALSIPICLLHVSQTYLYLHNFRATFICVGMCVCVGELYFSFKISLHTPTSRAINLKHYESVRNVAAHSAGWGVQWYKL